MRGSVNPWVILSTGPPVLDHATVASSDVALPAGKGRVGEGVRAALAEWDDVLDGCEVRRVLSFTEPHERHRDAAVATLVAVSLPVLVLLAAIAVNVAYMELVRTLLRISCDSAAKAALVRLGAASTSISSCPRSTISCWSTAP